MWTLGLHLNRTCNLEWGTMYDDDPASDRAGSTVFCQCINSKGSLARHGITRLEGFSSFSLLVVTGGIVHAV